MPPALLGGSQSSVAVTGGRGVEGGDSVGCLPLLREGEGGWKGLDVVTRAVPRLLAQVSLAVRNAVKGVLSVTRCCRAFPKAVPGLRRRWGGKRGEGGQWFLYPGSPKSLSAWPAESLSTLPVAPKMF